MAYKLNSGASPATPAAGKGEIYEDSADKRLKFIDETGTIHVLSNSGPDNNLIINGGFDIAQRQVPTSLTSYAAQADRVYGFDR